jgi:hypothetical protein
LLSLRLACSLNNTGSATGRRRNGSRTTIAATTQLLPQANRRGGALQVGS